MRHLLNEVSTRNLIRRVKDEFGWLSNTFAYPIHDAGEVRHTTEAFFRAVPKASRLQIPFFEFLRRCAERAELINCRARR